MTHKFGEFFLEPEWPCSQPQNFSHLPYLEDDDEDYVGSSKLNNYFGSASSIKLEPMEFNQHSSHSCRLPSSICSEDEIYESSEEHEEHEEADIFDQNIPQILKESRSRKDEKKKEKRSKSRPLEQTEGIKNLQILKKTKQLQRGKYKILSEDLKKKIVEETKTMTMVEVARKYNVSVNNICRWRKRCDRRLGAGRKVTDMEMEVKLLDWLMGQNYPIPRKEVQATARRMSKQEGFKASKGWFQRFYKRNKLHYNPNIEILTHNDYKMRVSQSMNEEKEKEKEQKDHDLVIKQESED